MADKDGQAKPGKHDERGDRGGIYQPDKTKIPGGGKGGKHSGDDKKSGGKK